MTISTTTARNTYTGSGTTGPFSFTFKIFAAADLRVVKRSSAGAETVLAFPADYSVSGVGNAAGGSITLVVALTVGELLSIRRVPANVQPTSIRNQGTFLPATHEDQFDRLLTQVQRLQDDVDRAVKAQESSDPAGLSMKLRPETGKVLTWQSPTEIGNSTLDSSAIALPGEGRTVGTVSAYLANNKTFHVLDFGAIGDGSTDDTAAIQAAMDACPAGGIVTLQGGRFRCTSTLAIDKEITLQGGDNRNQNLPGTDSVACLTFSTDVAVGIDATANVCIKSLIVSGVGLGVSTGIGIRAINFSLVLEDVVVQAWSTGIRVTSGFYNKFTRVRVDHCVVAALLDTCYNTVAVQCAFLGRQEANARGVDLINGSSMAFLGCSIESFRSSGIGLYNGSSATILGCYFEGTPELADPGLAVILSDNASVVAMGNHVYLTVNNKRFISVEGGGTLGVRVFSHNNRFIYPTDASVVEVYRPVAESTAFWDVAGDNWQSDAGIGCRYLENTFQLSPPAIGTGRFSIRYPVNYTDAVSDIVNLPPPRSTAIPSVASAANIVLPRGWELVNITGTTNITSITATNQTGRRVTLKFAGILTFTDGSNLKLNSNFVTSADDTITLVCDGTDWIEVSRSAN